MNINMRVISFSAVDKAPAWYVYLRGSISKEAYVSGLDGWILMSTCVYQIRQEYIV